MAQGLRNIGSGHYVNRDNILRIAPRDSQTSTIYFVNGTTLEVQMTSYNLTQLLNKGEQDGTS